MSATTAASTGIPAEAPRGALTPRLLSFFSGSVGLACKIALLAMSNALAVWAAVVLIIYTVEVAFTNYSIGHILTKTQAVDQIELTSLQPPPNGAQYTMAAARDAHGDLVLILQDQATHKNYVGTQDGLRLLPAGV